MFFVFFCTLTLWGIDVSGGKNSPPAFCFFPCEKEKTQQEKLVKKSAAWGFHGAANESLSIRSEFLIGWIFYPGINKRFSFSFSNIHQSLGGKKDAPTFTPRLITDTHTINTQYILYATLYLYNLRCLCREVCILTCRAAGDSGGQRPFDSKLNNSSWESYRHSDSISTWPLSSDSCHGNKNPRSWKLPAKHRALTDTRPLTLRRTKAQRELFKRGGGFEDKPELLSGFSSRLEAN